MWDQPLDESRSLRAFLAAEAVREQDAALVDRFVRALLASVHQDKQPAHDPATIRQVAEQVAGLDVERALHDLDRPELRERIAADYREATDQYGIFGTPTLLFAGGEPLFLKMAPPAPEDRALALWDSLQTFSGDSPFLREIKKPRKPEPS